ncbi:cilia- and flagella-associated protein 299 [Lampris incognitus]|uniref:cilia- and flagella-associated protein 299 n=1 Tax=Lampris incognitus TaxID=2546036 RepID=UPI0024B55316|nr:cilia- and flagella-associated protein 299 [Lampris incognitus]
MAGDNVGDDNATVSLDFFNQFVTYEDFLDYHITNVDLYYLKDKYLARQLVELGHLSSGSVMTREEFEARKAAAAASSLSKSNQQKTLASAGKELTDNFLRALAEREEANRSGKMNTIIFIRDYNSIGQEVSAYIDCAQRLRTEDFEPYFSGKKRLMPRRSDLSFYNWKTKMSMSNSSANYEVVTNNPSGLLFRNKTDGKDLHVDPWGTPGENSTRTPLQSHLYVQVVLYDHSVRTTEASGADTHCN